MNRVKRRMPTHRIYAVERRSAGKACWIDIGMAFTHNDGRGFDLVLQSMPLSAVELVARTRCEKRLADGSIIDAPEKERRGTSSAPPTMTECVTTEACA